MTRKYPTPTEIDEMTAKDRLAFSIAEDNYLESYLEESRERRAARGGED